LKETAYQFMQAKILNRELLAGGVVSELGARGRLALVFRRFIGGLEAIDADRSQSWLILRKLALDSMPAIRCKTLAPPASMGRHQQIAAPDRRAALERQAHFAVRRYILS
jgi:hypothetical protein